MSKMNNPHDIDADVPRWMLAAQVWLSSVLFAVSFVIVVGSLSWLIRYLAGGMA